MGHNNVISGHLKSTGIPYIDRLSMGPPEIRVSHILYFPFLNLSKSFILKKNICFFFIIFLVFFKRFCYGC